MIMESELKVSIYDFTKTQSPEGRTSDDGTGADDLRNFLADNWDHHEKIVILFEGIVKMSRVFIDEAFAKLLDNHTLDEFNQKIFFPDAKENIIKDMNSAFKLRAKIIKSQRAREDEDT